jgi:hypothetical protein
MSLPLPKIPLIGACSTIHNNTLYSYSNNAFQSLPLVSGAEWSQLPMGEPVTGAVCVQATPTDGNTPGALYIVGGKSNSSISGYQGLQRYIFSTGRWESISPATAVTQNRLYHNAVYLNASASILIYAGTQDGTMEASSQTFTISTVAPYTVLAFESIAPPAVSPLLMQWTESKAVMIGGSDTNKKVMIFSPSGAWTDSGATLAQPLKNMTFVKAAIVNGDDGSKNLFTFDMTVAPNEVNRTVLVDGNGNPVSNAVPVVSRSLGDRSTHGLTDSASEGVKRDNVTVDSWPPYNSTFVSSTRRPDYSLAEDETGQVVLSGGDTPDVICIFQMRDNCWVNPMAELAQVQSPDATSSIAGASATILPTVTASWSAIASGDGTPTVAGGDNTSTTASSGNALKILGAVLGSVVGVAIFLVLVLLLLRRRRRRRQFAEAGHQRRSSGIPEGEKDPMDFADRGIDFGTQLNGNHGHGQQGSQGSFSSMAILMGKVGQGRKLGVSGRRKGSNGSDSSSTFNKKYKTAISNPIPQNSLPVPDGFSRSDKGVSFAEDAPIPRPRVSGMSRRGSTRRSSGWNRYWSGGSAMNILGFGSKRTTSYSSTSNRTSDSQYSEAGRDNKPQVLQVSAIVSPLNFAEPAGRMSCVASNSPTVAHAESDFPLKEGMACKIERPGSSSSSVSSYDDHRDAFSSGIPASVSDENAWTPFGGNDWGQTGIPSAYSESNYTTILPRGMTKSSPAYTQMPRFPVPPDHRSPPLSSDMSWLNLGGTDRDV